MAFTYLKDRTTPRIFLELKSIPAEDIYVLNHESNGLDVSPYVSLAAIPPANRVTGSDVAANVSAVPVGVVSAIRASMRELKSAGHAGSAAKLAVKLNIAAMQVIVFISSPFL